MTSIGWIAAGCGATGAWLVGSQRRSRRFAGFALFLASNVLWLGWSIHGHEWEVLAQTVIFTVTSVRGLWLNRRSPDGPAASMFANEPQPTPSSQKDPSHAP